jgi:fluoride exporter
MRNVLIVGFGGCVGSILRYLVSGWIQGVCAGSFFPYGTLTVNMVGCLLIGFIGGLADHAELLSPPVRLFLMVGILGGFTTFSSFSYETVAMLRDRALPAAAGYVGLHLAVGLTATVIGYGISGLWR